MALRPGSEFNAHGLMTQERQLELETLAVNGGSVASVFAISAERAGLTPKGREAQRERERHRETMRVIMASEERIAAFQKKLDRLEREIYEARIETAEKLREARREEQEILDRAFKIETPDGRTIRVFRDGDEVYDEDDNLVSPDVIRAEDIPLSSPDRKERKQNRADIEVFVAKQSKLIKADEVLQEGREKTSDGSMTAEELEALDARVENHSRAALKAPAAEVPDSAELDSRRDITPSVRDASMPGPG